MGVTVALRKESVDRNTNPGSTSLTFPGSLSARRAWIEMRVNEDRYGQQYVALRKESVDRNMLYDTTGLMKCQSLSARRAWIEI